MLWRHYKEKLNDMNNRNKANIILASVFLLFAAATVLRIYIGSDFYVELTAFIFEAALVGGIADWFAVTALFRKPLGFSWHTAIIPNNRDKIVAKVSELVQNELISPEALTEKLTLLHPTEMVLDRLGEMLDPAFLEKQLSGFVADKVQSLDRGQISRSIDTMVRENLKKEGISVEIGNLLSGAIDRGNHRTWLLGMLRKAAEIAAKPETRDKIYHVLDEQGKYSSENASNAVAFFIKAVLNISNSSEHTNLRAISGVLQNELVQMLKELAHEDHPVFIKLQQKFEDLVKGLDSDESLTAAIQTWKNGILDRIDLVDSLNTLLSTAVQLQLDRNEAAAVVAAELDKYSRDLKKDDGMKKLVDGAVRTILGKIIADEHHLIGEIVGETLGAFTNERLNAFIEDKAGEDLQWIRINGSIVGAAAGALLFLFVNLLYQPHIVPFLQNLFGIVGGP